MSHLMAYNLANLALIVGLIVIAWSLVEIIKYNKNQVKDTVDIKYDGVWYSVTIEHQKNSTQDLSETAYNLVDRTFKLNKIKHKE